MKIIPGFQTGADQAGIDVAIKLNIPHGGAIPKGRMTEEGVLSAKYNAEELKTKFYPKRTEKNVVYSDGTVVCLKVFLADNDIEVLNVAGSRASKDSMIYEKTYAVIETTLSKTE